MRIEKTVVAEYFFRTENGKFWIDVRFDGNPHAQIGPFDTAVERQRAYDDLMACRKGG